jgi:hypothetical protein
MLRSDEILDFLKQHKQDLEARFSVRRIGLFGSVAVPPVIGATWTFWSKWIIPPSISIWI